MNFRIGFGYDVHQLQEGIPFWLGGIRIPHEKGAAGHSDADVLIHAICDALLGAAALGDIGEHFPDSDPALRGIASSILLRRTMEMVRSKGFELNNIDATICLQFPKIKPYVTEMRQELARQLEADTEQVSVKATTEEHLGFTGRGEGISAYAVVLIQSTQ